MSGDLFSGAIRVVRSMGNTKQKLTCDRCEKNKQLLLETKELGAWCKKCFHEVVAKPQGYKIADMSDHRLFIFKVIVWESVNSIIPSVISAYLTSTRDIGFVSFMEYLKDNGVYGFTTGTYGVKIATGEEEFHFSYSIERNDGRLLEVASQYSNGKSLTISLGTDSKHLPVYDAIFRAEMRKYVAIKRKYFEGQRAKM